MKLGLSSYTLTWSVGVPGYEPPVEPQTASSLIELTAQHGLQLIQFADNLPLHPMSDEELHAIKQIADKHGVAIEVGTRGTNPAHLLRYLEIAKLLEAKLVRTLITTPEIAQAEEELRTVLPAFEAADIVIAIENHGLQTVSQLTRLLDNLNCDHLGSCLDTVNSFGALEGPDPVIAGLAPYTVNLHIKDFEIKRVDHQMGFIILGTAAGAGRLDLERLRQALAANHKQPTAILELWTPYQGSVEETIALEHRWLHESLEYLNSIHFYIKEG